MSDKTEIRKKLKITRQNFQGESRIAADDAISEIFLQEFGAYESFFIYNSFSSEADTRRIITALIEAGKSVYLPRVDGENMVAVPYGETQEGAFGIAEPKGQAFEGEIEITVIPLLAVNHSGFRIGYGGGFYDRYLKNATTKKVGLGYFFQIENFEEDEWDIPLDTFLCERGLFCYENNCRTQLSRVEFSQATEEKRLK